MKKHPIHPYLITSAIAGIPFFLICITAAISMDYLTAIDIQVGQVFYQWGSDSFTRFVQNFTQIGNAVGIILSACLIAIIFGIYSKKWRISLWALITMLVGNGPIVDLIKAIVRRSRPEYLTHLVDQSGYSFPSGHSAGSVMIWGTLAFLIIYFFADQYPKIYPYLYGFVIFMMLALGGSRLYLGVHYPSDVIAGWSIGLVWLSLAICYFNLFIAEKEVSVLSPGMRKYYTKTA